MRGALLIVSQRAPYLRGGLSWPAAVPYQDDPRKQLVDIRDLDGERFRELVLDPVLTVQVGREGDFITLARVNEISVEAAQLMIDSIAEELPPRGEEPVADEDGELRDQLHRQAELIERLSLHVTDILDTELSERGHTSGTDLLDSYDRISSALALVETLSAANGRGDAETLGDWVLRLIGEVATAATDLAGERKLHAATKEGAALLAAEVDRLKAAAAKPPAKKGAAKD